MPSPSPPLTAMPAGPMAQRRGPAPQSSTAPCGEQETSRSMPASITYCAVASAALAAAGSWTSDRQESALGECRCPRPLRQRGGERAIIGVGGGRRCRGVLAAGAGGVVGRARHGLAVMTAGEQRQHGVAEILAGHRLESRIGDAGNRAPQPAIERVAGDLFQRADMSPVTAR